MNERKETNRVCFHHSLSKPTTTAAEIRTWHMQERGYSDIGYSFVIQGDGKIENGRPVDLIGAHNLGNNEDSVGVCFCGNFNQNDPTLFQYKSGVALYVDICKKYGKELKVEFHRVQPNPCPGRRFNREKFKTDCKTTYERYLAELPRSEPVQPQKEEPVDAMKPVFDPKIMVKKTLIEGGTVGAAVAAGIEIINVFHPLPITGQQIIAISAIPAIIASLVTGLRNLFKHRPRRV